ncbi:AI-2E family transporter [Pseudoroseicyclus tamaricis]|uniref:AI-2E family transporter n=1 Tax=Pseudoroseicyclus tamaricis TaxID=2705421 RepID=A0A6B2JUD1_9RHOB|nr:AI-2E family transporter [Pseudoroseicyclus tamaricis]NDV01535.1 AI-2E family transporter [Pseudoroseicyclus tamaricis]
MSEPNLRNLTYGTAMTLMIGWLLWVGRPVLLPIIAALISVYILLAAARAMSRLPVLRRLPPWGHHLLVLAGFTLAVALFFILIINNLAQVAGALPRYEANLEALVTQTASLMGIEDEPTWENVRRATIDRIELSSLITPALLSLRGLGTFLFLMVLYAGFFMAERTGLAQKVVMARGSAEEGAKTLTLLERINERIGGYLLVKTTLNVILGLLSFALLLLFGIEFALFWAVLIAFLNYVPYIGSLVGVIFPVVLSLAQYGNLGVSIALAVTLTAAQLLVGFWLEPRMMGRAFNLSPLVVLLALAVWSTLWGLPGAVLAVPMTASLVLVLAEIRQTRPIAVLLSGSGRV